MKTTFKIEIMFFFVVILTFTIISHKTTAFVALCYLFSMLHALFCCIGKFCWYRFYQTNNGSLGLVMLNYMGLSYNPGQVISNMQKGLTHMTHGCNNFLTFAEISTTNPPERTRKSPFFMLNMMKKGIYPIFCWMFRWNYWRSRDQVMEAKFFFACL